MASHNQVLLIGNLTRDPVLKYTPSHTAVAEFGLACNRNYTTATGEKREEVVFVDVAAFGKTAETINKFVKKGDPIFIDGRLKYDQWEDKGGAGKRQKISVIVNTFQFLNRSNGGPPRDSINEQADAQAAARKSTGPTPEPPAADDGGQQFKDDDIPF